MPLAQQIGALLAWMRQNPLDPSGAPAPPILLRTLAEALGRTENTLRMWERLGDPDAHPGSQRTPSPEMVELWAARCGYGVALQVSPAQGEAERDLTTAVSSASPAARALLRRLVELELADGGRADAEDALGWLNAWIASRR